MVLQGVGAQLVRQPDAPAFLREVQQHAPPLRPDAPQRRAQLRAAVAPQAAQQVAREALGMHTRQGCQGARILRAPDQDRQVLDPGIRRAERHDARIRRVLQRHVRLRRPHQPGGGRIGVRQHVRRRHQQQPHARRLRRRVRAHRGRQRRRQQPRQLHQRQRRARPRRQGGRLGRVGQQLVGGRVGHAAQHRRVQQRPGGQGQRRQVGRHRTAQQRRRAHGRQQQHRGRRRQRRQLPHPAHPGRVGRQHDQVGVTLQQHRHPAADLGQGAVDGAQAQDCRVGRAGAVGGMGVQVVVGGHGWHGYIILWDAPSPAYGGTASHSPKLLTALCATCSGHGEFNTLCRASADPGRTRPWFAPMALQTTNRPVPPLAARGYEEVSE